MFDIFELEGLINFLYCLPALLLSLSIHEFGHAIVAYKLGDKSQENLGRLTLSPFAHIDPLGFVCIALFGFGWGKPVMVDDRNFEKRGKGNMLVALAGPAFNLLLALLITLLTKLLMVTGIYNVLGEHGNIGEIAAVIILYTIQFNVVFAIFNLIPIPPFDGSKILYYFLPYNLKKWMDKIYKYSFLLLIILLVTPLVDILVMPAYSLISFVLMLILML